MKKCTKIDKYPGINKNISQIDKPLVSILLAVYKPNEKWLIEQLISLNEQSYPNLDLIVYDDCPEFPVDDSLFEKYITRFSYTIIRGSINRGSNKAFEELTKAGDGDYFAYCDQDDIWERDKITTMMSEFTDENVNLVCCDLSIINENGIKTYDSLTDVRKRIVYKSGYNLVKSLLMVNFVTGCAMITKKDVAVKAMPFLDELVHDQWIAIIASIDGKIKSVDKPLVRYRQHSMNQTGILKKVFDKESYYIRRIDDFIDRYKSIKIRLFDNDEVREYIDQLLLWLNARKRYSKKISIKDLKVMIKYRKFHKVSILIESVLPFIPDFIFKYIIKLTKKGLL